LIAAVFLKRMCSARQTRQRALRYAFCFMIPWLVVSYILFKITEVNVEEENIAHKRASMNVERDADDEKPKYILFWTVFFKWSSSISQQFPAWEKEAGLSFLGCPSSRCQLTTNRSLLPNVEMFDAIVFHQMDFDWEDLPVARSPEQSYVFFTLEAAAHRQGGLPNRIEELNKIPGFFNLTMTYRHDSDIHTPYGQFVQKRPPMGGRLLEEYIQKFGRENKHLAAKTGSQGLTIAQYVSNCITAVGRENLVDMIDYITPVDIYGNCGDLYCPQWEEARCLNLLGDTYKFYLSFENAMCRDYITEKFFRVLNQNTIPIVFTGANMSTVAPPHSFINVADFQTIQDLVGYLKRVASDDALFASYFWWRTFYTVKDDAGLQAQYWCGLCDLLWKRGGDDKSSVKDLYNFWVNQANCSTLKIGLPPRSPPASF